MPWAGSRQSRSSVARMVGLPTSSTASTATCARLRPWFSGRRAVAHDVLHHHDRVVHQDADGEDQREQRDAVQRVAVEIEDGERERQRDGDRDEHDAGFAQPSVSAISDVTESTAISMWNSSSLDFSLAVSP